MDPTRGFRLLLVPVFLALAVWSTLVGDWGTAIPAAGGALMAVFGAVFVREGVPGSDWRTEDPWARTRWDAVLVVLVLLVSWAAILRALT